MQLPSGFQPEGGYKAVELFRGCYVVTNAYSGKHCGYFGNSIFDEPVTQEKKGVEKRLG
jgi:hypothetical protein